MAFITVPMDKGKEQTLAPEGEYELIIRKVNSDKPSRAGKPMVRIMIGFVGRPDLSPFTHFMNLPTPDMDEDQVSMRVRDIRRFCHVFSIPVTEEGFDTEDFLAASGWCKVIVETGTKDNGEVFESNRLALPRVKEE